MAGLRDCVAAALDAGKITKEEATEMVRKVRAYEGVEADGGMPHEARTRIEAELRAEDIETQRRSLLQARALRDIDASVNRAAMFNNRGDLVQTLLGRLEAFGDQAQLGVNQLARAHISKAQETMADLLRTFRRSALTMRRLSRDMLDDVVRAGWGENVSEEAKRLYESFRQAAEHLRTQFNEAGGAIGYAKNWVMPQAHNARAILRAGFEKWRDYIDARLDWDKMQHPISGLPIQPHEREGVLRAVHDAIVTDGWNTREPGSTAGGRGAMWRRRSDARFLQFKNADGWLEYSRAYGGGEPYGTMLSHIRQMAGEVALMQKLGPNPDVGLRYMKDLLHKNAATLKLGTGSTLNATPATADARATLAAHMLDAVYERARGSYIPHSIAGDTIAIIRAGQYAAKTAGAVITHTFGNTVIQGMARHLAGLPVLTTLTDTLKAFGSTSRKEMLQAGVMLEDWLFHHEHGAREDFALSRVREFSQWLPQASTHYSGLNGVMAAEQRSSALGFMAGAANNLGKSWDHLDRRFRDNLEGFGLTREHWAIMQKAELHEPVGGAPFLRAAEIEAVRGDGISARQAYDAAMAYRGVLAGTIDNHVPQSSWRARATWTGMTKEGTVPGEIARSMSMFKGGFMGSFMLSQIRQITREYRRAGMASAALPAGAAAATGVAGFLIASVPAMTLAGLAILQLKQMRMGKDMLAMNPLSPEGRGTLAHAYLTSGALGLFGDFIHADLSSYGHNLAATFMGPMVSTAEEFADVGKAALHGKGKAKAAVKILRNNTPILSTHPFFAAAYNRALDSLQTVMDPDAPAHFRTQEQRLRHETKQGYWWRPGQSSPERLPQVAR